MIDNRVYKHQVILVLILIAGLGMTLAAPLPASSQNEMIDNESDAKGGRTGFRQKGRKFGLFTIGSDQHPLGSEELLAPSDRYYVAKTGDGTDPGGGWSTAFTNIQDALAAASLAGGGEIWVAAGVYYPDIGGGQTNNDVHATFTMADGVALYGGFDTLDTQFAERDWESNLTVLSGDIDKNDINFGDGVVRDWMHIDVDPKFISYVNPNAAPTTDGDLRLKSSSPAIEAGDNTFVAGVLTDLAGETRIVDGDGDYFPIVDMGAYEYQVYYRYLPLTNR